jgi:IclR family pca regulon transcriptional regulator
MGRVLLAGLSREDLDAYLDRVRLDRLTAHTVVDVENLRTEIDTARRQGYCIVEEELELGLRSLAAPIVDPEGHVVAAVNISTQAARYSLDVVHDELVPAVRATADAISADLARTKHRPALLDRGTAHA